jgi:hypothetical protein
MNFVGAPNGNETVAVIMDTTTADELFELGPKFSVSSFRLFVRLYRADAAGSETIGVALSNRYLRRSLVGIQREAPSQEHHMPTPEESPHYIECGRPVDHSIRQQLAVNILGLLSQDLPPPEPGNVTADNI